MTTRLARPEDRAAIWTLYQNAMRQHIESIWGWDEDWQTADFDKAFSTSATYVVERDSEFSGYIQLDMKEGENYLRMIALTPRLRSKGIGASLLAEILQLSQQAGCRLRLRVFRVNGLAKRFYEREGWQVEAEDDAFFLMTHASNETSKAIKPSRVSCAKNFEMLVDI
ncbi:MAG: GNAT family N-acetyltransferase [Pseudomonadota bacterium]